MQGFWVCSSSLLTLHFKKCCFRSSNNTVTYLFFILILGQFAHLEHAKAAQSLNGKLEIAGRTIKVDFFAFTLCVCVCVDLFVFYFACPYVCN